MKKLILSAITITIIVISGNTYALKTVKVYPDYTINVRLDTEPGGTEYQVSISIRNNATKETIKGWNMHDTAIQVKLNSSGELKSFTKKFDLRLHQEGNYKDAFNFAVETAFHLALIIQDAGLIPQIDFKEFDLTNSAGGMTNFNNFQYTPTIPTGEWRNVR